MSGLRKGLFYTTIGRYGNFFITLLVNAILSRLLTPTDYGVVAIIMVFVTFFQLLSNIGIGPAIVQSKKLNQQDVSSLYGFSVLFSIILPLLFLVVGIVLCFFYNNKIFFPLSIVLAISLIFYTLVIVPDALLTKEKRFMEINLIFLASTVVGGVVGIFMAISGFGVYSLVWNNAITSLINYILKSRLVRIKIRKLSNESFNKIKTFVKNQFLASLITYLGKNLDNLLIGKNLGASDLGNYSKAYQLIMYPNFLFASIINSILLPFLSDIQEDTKEISSMYLNVLKILLLFGLPLSLFMTLFGKQIIFFIFGTQWSKAVFPFEVLSLSVWIQMIQSSAEPIFQAKNRTDQLLSTSVFSLVAIAIAIVMGLLLGTINYVSIFLTISFFISLVYRMYVLMKKVLFVDIRTLLKTFERPVLIGVIYLIVGLISKRYVEMIDSNFYQLLLAGFIWLITLLTLLFIFGELKKIKEYVK